MGGFYRKGYSNRINKALSTRRIFGRKNKHSQATQIYALKKKLFGYIKRTRPETIIQQHTSDQTLLPSSEVETGGAISVLPWSYIDSTGATYTANYLEPKLGTPVYTESGISTKNDFARIYNILIEGVMRYQDNADSNPPVTMRLVIVQTKTTRAQEITVNDVFRRSITPDDSDSQTGNALAVYGPLQSGVSSTCAILYDRIYTISNRLPARKITINLRRLINFRRDTNSVGSTSSESVPKGRIYVFCARSISSLDTAGVSQTQLILNAKLAFPDN